MSSMAEHMFETYNTSFLNSIDNITIRKLLENNYTKHMPVVKFLGGPKGLTVHWSPKYQKMIYTFGERHSFKTDCERFDSDQSQTMKVEDFFKSYLQTTNAFIDFFIEVQGYSGSGYEGYEASKTIPSGLSRLKSIHLALMDCIQYSTRSNSLCDLARVHYIDVRKNSIEGIDTISFLRDMLNEVQETIPDEEKADMYKRIVEFPRINKFLNKLTGDYNSIKNAFIEQLDDNKSTQKELDRSPLGKEIRKFISMKIEQILQEDDLYITIKKIVSAVVYYDTDEYLVMFMEELPLLFVSINARIMDAYALARMFKTFNTDLSDSETGTHRHHPTEAHNIIIYTGNNHSNIYREFFEITGFHLVASTGTIKEIETESDEFCIDMTSIPQPFFQYTEGM
jgi:hypothetical protein